MCVMGKIAMLMLLSLLSLLAGEINSVDVNLKKNCLECHQTQQIPNRLISRRYLMKYSTKERIEEAMRVYLKNPKKSQSIMPPQFFLKFPMKGVLFFNEEVLRKNIQAFIEHYDIQKELTLEKNK